MMAKVESDKHSLFYNNDTLYSGMANCLWLCQITMYNTSQFYQMPKRYTLLWMSKYVQFIKEDMLRNYLHENHSTNTQTFAIQDDRCYKD